MTSAKKKTARKPTKPTSIIKEDEEGSNGQWLYRLDPLDGAPVAEMSEHLRGLLFGIKNKNPGFSVWVSANTPGMASLLPVYFLRNSTKRPAEVETAFAPFGKLSVIPLRKIYWIEHEWRGHLAVFQNACSYLDRALAAGIHKDIPQAQVIRSIQAGPSWWFTRQSPPLSPLALACAALEQVAVMIQIAIYNQVDKVKNIAKGDEDEVAALSPLALPSGAEFDHPVIEGSSNPETRESQLLRDSLAMLYEWIGSFATRFKLSDVNATSILRDDDSSIVRHQWVRALVRAAMEEPHDPERRLPTLAKLGVRLLLRVILIKGIPFDVGGKDYPLLAANIVKSVDAYADVMIASVCPSHLDPKSSQSSALMHIANVSGMTKFNWLTHSLEFSFNSGAGGRMIQFPPSDAPAATLRLADSFCHIEDAQRIFAFDMLPLLPPELPSSFRVPPTSTATALYFCTAVARELKRKFRNHFRLSLNMFAENLAVTRLCKMQPSDILYVLGGNRYFTSSTEIAGSSSGSSAVGKLWSRLKVLVVGRERAPKSQWDPVRDVMLDFNACAATYSDDSKDALLRVQCVNYVAQHLLKWVLMHAPDEGVLGAWNE